MAFRFFHVSSRASADEQQELNSFLGNHRILTVDRRFVELGENSFWAICIDYLPAAPADGSRRTFDVSSSKRIDYREVLTPEQFAIYSRLRDLRKELAAAEAVPIYTIFTNKQLADLTQMPSPTMANLRQIEGIGQSRVERFGDRILQVLSATAETNETNQKSV